MREPPRRTCVASKSSRITVSHSVYVVIIASYNIAKAYHNILQELSRSTCKETTRNRHCSKTTMRTGKRDDACNVSCLFRWLRGAVGLQSVCTLITHQIIVAAALIAIEMRSTVPRTAACVCVCVCVYVCALITHQFKVRVSVWLIPSSRCATRLATRRTGSASPYPDMNDTH